MIKKLSLLFINFIVVLSLLNAQTDAKKALDGVNNKIKSAKSITAKFSYTTKDFNNNNMGTQEGQIIIKGNSYNITQGNTEIISDGSKIWNYNGENEVMETDAEDETNKMLSPRNLLAGEYDKDFTYRLMPTTRTNFYVIEMKPVDKRKIVKRITIYINKAQNLITRAIVVDRGSNTLSFTFSDISVDADIDNSKFTFDAARHPGVEVIKQ